VGVVSASEANRSFSLLLRQMAQGETFTVLSRGRPIATISPAQPSHGAQQAARATLLARLGHQPASGESRRWRRDELYD
jgi:antitoxin (DNA-binding transcriptional repressor) of toxin-antitoxin stability system